MSFRISPKVPKYFGYLWKQICHREHSKIAQSGHTDSSLPIMLCISAIVRLLSIIICDTNTTQLTTWANMAPNRPKSTKDLHNLALLKKGLKKIIGPIMSF